MAATGVFPMSAVIFRIFLVCQSLRVECASEQLITYICQLRPKTMSFQAVITRIIIWTSPRKVSVFGIFDIFVFMTPGRVLSTSPRFKIVRVLSSWNSLATTEVTLLVLTVSKTCSGLPSVAQESWMTVTANRCWRNFVVDFSGLIISSSTLLRKFHGYNPDILLRVWEIPSQSHDFYWWWRHLWNLRFSKRSWATDVKLCLLTRGIWPQHKSFREAKIFPKAK